jgi:FkbM family methyltransferase
MRISSRALLQRLVTYPALLTIMPLYSIATNKKPILDAFYLIRGFPHGYLKGKNRVAFYDGLMIVFPFDEDPSFDDVWLRNVYYPYVPQRQHIVIDAGAHMGNFTLKIARHVKKVIAIEPEPVSYKFLALNIHLNKLEDKAFSYNLALGEKNGQTYLDRSRYGFGRTKTTTEKTNYPVSIRTIDSLAEEIGLEQVNLIKIDTEGSELEILKGARKTIQRYKPDLLIAAYHFKDEHLTVADYLQKQGYTVFNYRVPLFLSSGEEIYLCAKNT